jgi:Zn-dependent protease with chaperone function
MRIACVGLLALLLVAAPARAQSDDAEEVRLGQVYSRRLEAQYRLLHDAAGVERVTRIGAIVAAASDRPSLPYTFKILDLEVPNALSLPGGFIYVTRGLLSFIRSDHELAAVLAHEIVHAAHSHQVIAIRRSNEAAFWTVLVALLSREPAVMIGAQMISVGLMSGYSRDLEREADLTAVSYLVKTAYTPVAELTLMERLARQEQLSPQPDRAVVRDHPIATERVAYIAAELNRRGIPIIRRVAANYLRVTVLTFTEQAHQVGEILVNETFLVLLPDPARVGVIAARLNRFFDTDPDPSEVSALRTADGWEIVGGRELLMTLTRADAEFMGMPVNTAAGEIQARLLWVIRQDQRMRQFNG